MYNWEKESFSVGEVMMGYIKDGAIYNQQNVLVGRTEEEYQKVIKVSEELEEQLYIHGILERPKTQEQIQQEQNELIAQQAEMLKSVMATMEAMKKEFDTLKGGKNAKKSSNESGGKENVAGTTQES